MAAFWGSEKLIKIAEPKMAASSFLWQKESLVYSHIVITIGKGVAVEEGIGNINDDGRRFDLRWETHNTIYRRDIIELYHLKPT